MIQAIRRYVEHLDADDLSGRIEVQNDSRSDLFRLDDIRFIEAQVKRVDLLRRSK